MASSSFLPASNLPTGDIAKSNGYAYGFEEGTYYVTLDYFGSLATTARMSLEEAKALYEAFLYVDPEGAKQDYPRPARYTASLRDARRKKLEGDALMWHFVDFMEA